MTNKNTVKKEADKLQVIRESSPSCWIRRLKQKPERHDIIERRRSSSRSGRSELDEKVRRRVVKNYHRRERGRQRESNKEARLIIHSQRHRPISAYYVITRLVTL